NTIDIDTGCVFGGALTCLRYPEQELVSVPALKVYCTPVKPLIEKSQKLSSQQMYDSLLDVKDYIGKQFIHTKLRQKVTVQEENSKAALEVMSRFAIEPRWLIYLPPTMAPTAVSDLPEMLEHPKEAFQYYKKSGVKQVVCEEKHMGSRAILVICKDQEVAQRRFGATDGKAGICYTRTGRNFFTDPVLEKAFINRVMSAMTDSGLWETLKSDWVCIDAEIMPWSMKAKTLIKDQYAAVGTSATHGLEMVADQLKIAANRYGEALHPLIDKVTAKQNAIEQYKTAFGHYCWEVKELDDITVAPFHIMASEGEVHTDKNHLWHLTTLKRLAEADPDLFRATAYQFVQLDRPDEVARAIDWWTEMTEHGGEGIVVKPSTFIAKDGGKLLQPAIKCRGAEYLRIIYGPEYQLGESTKLLKERKSGRKKSLALTEFALGVEGLDRFVAGRPLRDVHQCAFGVLALETEPIDPRL
ncbi:MAG: polynucleotide kinase-phosphatase, partial [Bacteroidota bacterium]